MENPKNSLLYAFYSFRPFVEAYWEKNRSHTFVNNLSEVLKDTQLQLEKVLAETPQHGEEFRLSHFMMNSDNKILTAREFLILLFRLDPLEVSGRDGETIPGKLNDILDKAEECFLRHIVRDVNRRADFHTQGGAYRLKMSNIISTRTDANGNFPLRKKAALFTIKNFMTELTAAGVPIFYAPIPTRFNEQLILEMYDQLPNSVKELFFGTTFQGKLNDNLPMYLIRDILMYTDNEKWEQLKQSCLKDKKTGTEELTNYLRGFLEVERKRNYFRLGAPHKDNTDPQKLGPKALSFLELLKPANWIGRIGLKIDPD